MPIADWQRCGTLQTRFSSGVLAAFARRSISMDDIYKINVAKTEFREAYNTGDVDRLLAVFTLSLIHI